MNNVDESRWASMSLAEQMANIGSEVGRSAKWLAMGKAHPAESAFLRALDLIDLTIRHGREGKGGRASLLRELCRARECYVGAFKSSNGDMLSSLDIYFGKFAAICRPNSARTSSN